ncbi:MAG: hypothetical protein OSB33_04550 [Candidatus Poseidoniales archaeon]|nr:hypothetical protein [Candidatus Poseidoniales archaeon]
MRRLAPLLVLLFLMPSFSGCIGGPNVTWGSSNGEYSTSFSSDSSSVSGPEISVTNKLSSSSTQHYDADSLELKECNGTKYSISGWLVQTKVFDQPQVETYAVTSWMLLQMPYEEAQDVEPGSVFVSIVNSEKDWSSPKQAEGIPMVDGNLENGKASEFPHRHWTLLAIIPANENVFDAAIQMDTNQAVKLNGYLEDVYISPDQLNGCDIDASNSGWGGHFIVTSMTYGDERIVNSDDAYIGGDIPFFGRGLYTTMLLISIVASGALYIFSRNQILLGADSQAQAMLSEQQMKAGKSARHEAARHDARMAAATQTKKSEYTGKPTKKSVTASTFDISAALAEQTPGSTEHYVAGSSVVSTDEADAMDDMISEMQEEQALEQELQAKGLRGIIGSQRQAPSTKPHSSRLSTSAESKPKPKSIRKTRKTQTANSEPKPTEEEEEKTVRKIDPEVNDEGDFSDFSL